MPPYIETYRVTTTDVPDLAHWAVACEGWRWLPGMLTLDDVGERMSDEGWPLYEVYDGACGVLQTVEWCDTAPLGALPDLADPATLGCLTALVRAAWSAPLAQVAPLGSSGAWVCCLNDEADTCFRGHSEAEALVAALDAASPDSAASHDSKETP